MSYEYMYQTKKVCDCGKGFFVVETWQNDWNQYREEKRIDCPICKEFFCYRNEKRVNDKYAKVKGITTKPGK